MRLFEEEIVTVSKIRTVGLFKSSTPAVKHYPVTLTTYELILHFSGEALVRFGDQFIKDEPNSLRYLPKDATDGEYTVEIIQPGFCIDIYFDTPDKMPGTAMALKNMTALKSLFLKMYHIWTGKKDGYYTQCMSILYDIIRKIKEYNDAYFFSSQKQKILPAYSYMLQNYRAPSFSYPQMCLQTGLSYDYFKELFIRIYGMSPVKYVTMLRMEYAKELLITGHYSITDIAELSGFENVYYFSTVFKKHVGLSPKQYRSSQLHGYL